MEIIAEAKAGDVVQVAPEVKAPVFTGGDLQAKSTEEPKTNSKPKGPPEALVREAKEKAKSMFRPPLPTVPKLTVKAPGPPPQRAAPVNNAEESITT